MCSRCLRYLAPLNPVVQHVWRNAGRQFCCFGNRAGCPRLLPCPETPAGANAQDAVPASKSPITAPAKHEGSITTRPGWIADLDEASGQWYEMSEATGESRWLDNPPPGAGPMSVTEADAEHDGRKRTTVPSLARPALAESAHAKKLLLGSEARAFWIEFAAKQTRMLEAQKKANALEAAATAGLNEVEVCHKYRPDCFTGIVHAGCTNVSGLLPFVPQEEDESVAGSFDDEIHSIKNVPMHTRRRPGATAAMGGSAGRHQRGSSRRSQRKGAGGKMSSPSEAHTAKHSADESVQHNDLEPW